MPRHWRDHEHGHGEYGRGDYGRERGERRDDRSAEPGQELSRRDYGGARFTRGMERDVIAPDPGGRAAAGMGPDDMGPDDRRGGMRSNADWSGSGRGYEDDGRDAPFSHGGMGHRQRQGMGMGGEDVARYRRHPDAGPRPGYGYDDRDDDSYGARWAPFGGHDAETRGPRSQRGLGRWRETYGSGEGYGRGGGPAGQMDDDRGDYGRGYYGRDMGGDASHRGPSHRGKGPKGYERSPERLKEDLCERLTEADDVDASEISVSVRDGIVTLEGSVPERRMKHRAEDIADACPGVKDVENRLKVLRPGETPPAPQAAPPAASSGRDSDSQPETPGRPPRFGNPLRH